MTVLAANQPVGLSALILYNPAGQRIVLGSSTTTMNVRELTLHNSGTVSQAGSISGGYAFFFGSGTSDLSTQNNNFSYINNNGSTGPVLFSNGTNPSP